ncbi:MAG TPA: hypothetical protein DCS17_02125 [Flavobacterium sp.]|nr:hypothetical protein [Flavobacterium sp.]
MKISPTITPVEEAFSNLSAEDIENLEVEELEERLELATIDYMIAVGIVSSNNGLPDVCRYSIWC